LEKRRDVYVEIVKPIYMKAPRKRTITDIRHHVESIWVMSNGLLRDADKLPEARIDKSVVSEIIRLSKLIIKK
jgi:hypothetical protein